MKHCINPLKAIRKYCLDCMEGNKKEVRECKDKECYLHQYRFGRKPKQRENNLFVLRSIQLHCQQCREEKRIDVERCNEAGCSLVPFCKGHNPNRKGIGNSNIYNLKKTLISDKGKCWGYFMPGDVITKQELADLLKVEVKTIKWLVTSRQIPCFKAGKEVRFFRSQIEAWAKARVYMPLDVNKLTPRR